MNLDEWTSNFSFKHQNTNLFSESKYVLFSFFLFIVFLHFDRIIEHLLEKKSRNKTLRFFSF